jgi:hypothetical protein
VHAEDVTGMVTADARGEEGAVVAAMHAVTAVTEAGHQLGERARDAAVVPSGFGDRAGESVARRGRDDQVGTLAWPRLAGSSAG